VTIYAAAAVTLILLIAASFIGNSLLKIAVVIAVYSVFFGALITSIKRGRDKTAAAHEECLAKLTAKTDGLINNIKSTLSDKADMVPVLVNQLQEVTQQTEAAAMDIGGRFMNIVERARNQTAGSGGMFNGDGSEDALNLSKTALTGVIEGLQLSMVIANQALSSMQQILKETESVKNIVKEIGYIAGRQTCWPLTRR
jgi:hypothetical protein